MSANTSRAALASRAPEPYDRRPVEIDLKLIYLDTEAAIEAVRNVPASRRAAASSR